MSEIRKIKISPGKAIKKVRSAFDSPLSAAVFILLAWLPVNIWAAAGSPLAWEATGYLIVGILAFGLALLVPRFKRSPVELAWLLIGGITLLACISIPFINFKEQLRLFNSGLYMWLENLSIPYQETIHSNVLASAILQGMPLAIVMIPLVNRGRQRMIAISITITLLSIFLFTQGRGALLGLCIALVIMGILSFRIRLLWFLPVIAFAAIWLVKCYGGIRKIGDAFMAGPGLIGGGASRLDIWRASYLAVSDFPFTGIGIGAFSNVIPLYYPLQVDIKGFPHAHNLLFQVALDTGLPGLIAYLTLLLLVLYMQLFVIRQRGNRAHSLLALGLFGSTIAMLIDGIFSTANWGTKLAFIPWLLYALTVLLYKAVLRNALSPATLLTAPNG